jgi:hypothetical protein
LPASANGGVAGPVDRKFEIENPKSEKPGKKRSAYHHGSDRRSMFRLEQIANCYSLVGSELIADSHRTRTGGIGPKPLVRERDYTALARELQKKRCVFPIYSL